MEDEVRIWAKWFAIEEICDERDVRDALLKAMDHLPLDYLAKEYGADASSLYSEPYATEVMARARRRFSSGKPTGINLNGRSIYANRSVEYKPGEAP